MCGIILPLFSFVKHRLGIMQHFVDNRVNLGIIYIGYIYGIKLRVISMLINTDTMFSMTQANQNFSQIARSVDKNGEAVLIKNNKPKYVVLDIDSNRLMLDLTEEEKIELVAKRILNRYLPAFKELAK